ncbi:MAG: hypothetical protein UX42_C0007G0005 [Microgenomates group bacterium GW2011_GWC1_46_20]|nr:MAG: hypothetical protein UX42_C0007G0005 [Microgenomates group bacterium GW2011_GWC1_46_20]
MSRGGRRNLRIKKMTRPITAAEMPAIGSQGNWGEEGSSVGRGIKVGVGVGVSVGV